MARLPSSGPLDIGTINAEFKRGTQFANYLNAPHDAGRFPTSNLSIAHFYGRMSAFEVDYRLGEHYESWDLYWWTRGLGWDGVVPVLGTYRIANTVVVFGRADGHPALLVHDFPPNSVITLILEGGAIIGRGGAGAADGAGGPGSTGLYVRSPVTVHNWGLIAGGGGGGYGIVGMRGGGGATYGQPNGGLTGGGLGQAFGGNYGSTHGGAGGGPGEWGQGYFDFYGTGPYESGGPPGLAVDGNGFITWAAYNDVRGPLA